MWFQYYSLTINIVIEIIIEIKYIFLFFGSILAGEDKFWNCDLTKLTITEIIINIQELNLMKTFFFGIKV